MIKLPSQKKATDMWRRWCGWAKQWRAQCDPNHRASFHEYDTRLGRNSPISSIDIQRNSGRYDLDRR